MNQKELEKISGYRIKRIARLIPLDVESVLDIGCGEANLKPLFKKYVGIDLKGAEINQDLNKKQKVGLPSKSFDLVILSQILEHLTNPSELIAEAKRMSKKYVLVGLPSEYTIDNRIRVLLNKRGTGYDEFGHKHWFNIDSAEKFVHDFFGRGFKKKEFIFAVKGGKILPDYVKDSLAKKMPNFFAKEVYYLFEAQKTK